MTDLEQLSREAAKVLHQCNFDFDNLFYCHDGQSAGKYHDGNDDPSVLYWLHESTEACAEIMVRVLWPLGVDVRKYNPLKGDAPDDMQAFRTAVLRALIEVKK